EVQYQTGRTQPERRWALHRGRRLRGPERAPDSSNVRDPYQSTGFPTPDSYTPNGIRTRVAAVRGRCPRLLDDGGIQPEVNVGVWSVHVNAARFFAGKAQAAFKMRRWTSSGCQLRMLFNNTSPRGRSSLWRDDLSQAGVHHELFTTRAGNFTSRHGLPQRAGK